MKRLTTSLCLTVTLLFGCTGVCKSADWNTGQAAYKRGDFTAAIQEWQPLAVQGNAKAQNNMGWLYAKGEGVPRNYKTAVYWYKRSAENGFERWPKQSGFNVCEGKWRWPEL